MSSLTYINNILLSAPIKLRGTLLQYSLCCSKHMLNKLCGALFIVPADLWLEHKGLKKKYSLDLLCHMYKYVAEQLLNIHAFNRSNYNQDHDSMPMPPLGNPTSCRI